MLEVYAKIWHPCGAECYAKFNGQMEPIQSMPQFLQYLASQGWLTENPNKPAEPLADKIEEIGGLARLQKLNSNGSVADIVAFYSTNDKLKKRVSHVYIDTPEQANAFMMLTGIDVKTMPIFDGSTAPERNALTMQKMVGTHFKITLSPNPNYSDAKAKKAAADKAAGIPNVAPYTVPMRIISKFETAGGQVVNWPKSSPPKSQQQGQYTQPPSGVNSDRRVEQQPGTGARPPQSGPVNGVITDPDFRKLLLAKGKTWHVAMSAIDRQKGTQLATNARTVGDIPGEILADYLRWLRQQPDIQQRPDAHVGGGIPF